MIKAILFDFSRTLLNAKDPQYADSLNGLYKRISQQEGFNSLDHFEFNQKLLDFAVELKEKYDLYIFTTGTIQDDMHLKRFTDGVFKRVFTVEEVGFPKDNSEAYTVIAKELSLLPEEILFTDDTEKNIKAAEEAGLKTIQFISQEQVINDIQSHLKVG